MDFCRWKDYRITSCQSWRSKKKSAPLCGHQSQSVINREWPRFEFKWVRIILKVCWIKTLTYRPVIKAGSILRIGFTLSKWPHFHRTYVVTTCKQRAMTLKCLVYAKFINNVAVQSKISFEKINWKVFLKCFTHWAIALLHLS